MPFRKTLAIGSVLFGLSYCGDATINNNLKADVAAPDVSNETYIPDSKDSNEAAQQDIISKQDIISEQDSFSEEVYDLPCEKKTLFADNDGDGLGDENNPMVHCGPMPGFVENKDDCDDTNSAIFQKIYCSYDGEACGNHLLCLEECLTPPEEVCDGLDNNCNGIIDEGCVITFEKTFGGENFDECLSVQQTSDDGFILTGWTTSFGAKDYDIYLVKTDSQGNEEWFRTFGGWKHDYGRSVQQTLGGGYVVGGRKTKVVLSLTGLDAYLIKTDSGGNVQQD